jgi:hypothetical protein
VQHLKMPIHLQMNKKILFSFIFYYKIDGASFPFLFFNSGVRDFYPSKYNTELAQSNLPACLVVWKLSWCFVIASWNIKEVSTLEKKRKNGLIFIISARL